MIILGIDPGLATTGFGVITTNRGKHSPVEYGTVLTKAKTLLEDRLLILHNEIGAVMDRHKPDAVSIEELFFNTNTTTAVDVCQARGVILLAAVKRGLPLYEYTPLQVKQAVVGYGRAEKQQVIYMTRVLLGLDAPPKPDDAADALAIAICHANNYQSFLVKNKI